jgi:two-component system chemotaxis sensor kinase CheA
MEHCVDMPSLYSKPRFGLRSKLTLSNMLMCAVITVVSLLATSYVNSGAAKTRADRRELLHRAHEVASLADSGFEESFAYVASSDASEKAAFLATREELRAHEAALELVPDLNPAEVTALRKARDGIATLGVASALLFEEFERTGTIRTNFHSYEDVIDSLAGDLEHLNTVIDERIVTENRDLARANEVALLGIGLAAIVAAILMSAAFGRRLVRPLESLHEAAVAFGRGELDFPISTSGDEIGQLGAALRNMAGDVRSLLLEIERKNASLQELIAERTRELAVEKLVLDNTGDGLLIVDFSGGLCGHRSMTLANWFGEPDNDPRVWEYLYVEQVERDAFFSAFQQLTEDTLPFAVNAHQMPQALQRNGRSYELQYRQVFEDGHFSRLLIVVRDVTAQVEASRLELIAREEHAIMRQLLGDSKGFFQCVADCKRLMHELLTPADLKAVKFNLHTLKGNSAGYGFQSVANQCHEIESAMIERSGPPTSAELSKLELLWQTRLDGIQDFTASIYKDESVEIAEAEYAWLVDALIRRREHDEILRFVAAWRWAHTREYLGRLRVLAERAAMRLSKLVEVDIEHNSLRLPPELTQVWPTLVHVVRNAVDHGVEEPDERQARGKQPRGHVRLVTRIENDTFTIEISDDGRGIDVDALALAAQRQGLPLRSASEIVDAVFAAGVSTKATVTELSGRGLGLAATREACEAAGGLISVHSRCGEGTTFECRFPLARLDGSARGPILPVAAPG